MPGQQILPSCRMLVMFVPVTISEVQYIVYYNHFGLILSQFYVGSHFQPQDMSGLILTPIYEWSNLNPNL